MKPTTKHVAVDGHQSNDPCLGARREWPVIARTILPTDGPVLTEFFRGMRGAIHVAIALGGSTNRP